MTQKPHTRGFTAQNEKQYESTLSYSSSESVAKLSPRGFTLVETLVAISIVVTAIVGPLYAVQQSLSASRTAREQLVASFLAQEAIEYVRYVRDSNYLYTLNTGPVTWLMGFDGTNSTPNCFTSDCIVDPKERDVRLKPGDASLGFLYLNTNKLYTLSTSNGTKTLYKRIVRFSTVSGSTTEVLVTTTVTWETKGETRTVVFKESLHNWL